MRQDTIVRRVRRDVLVHLAVSPGSAPSCQAETALSL